MNIVKLLSENRLDLVKEEIFNRLNDIVSKRLTEAKVYVATDRFDEVEDLSEAKKNVNIIKMGRIQKIRRRIRRNSKGRIVLQKNIKRSGVKGYRMSGNTVKRISATTRIKKARLLKRSWKTTRRSKLRRTLLKRKLSMRRRKSLGIK